MNQLATQAARAAARLRADHGVGPADAVCPYDLALRLGIIVRFAALPSMEGMYAPTPTPTIFISSERPAGRRRYTCAHELGHHVFGHGTRLDELEDGKDAAWSPEEFLADRFAAGLLMPKLAVESAFARRGYSIVSPQPEELFIVAQDLGVGYATLVGHLERTLRRISSTTADALRKRRLTELRSRLAGFQGEHDVFVADEHWGRRPIDTDVGDVVCVPPSVACTGSCVSLRLEPSPHLLAVAPGVARLVLDVGEPPASIRVSRRGFTGLARYRHVEEVADDE